MSRRPIHRLRVFGSIRQIEAAEVCRWRYPVALLLLAGLAWPVSQMRFPDDTGWARVLLFFVLLAGVLTTTQPWHRRLHVDKDTETVTMEWRLLGMLPFGRSLHDLTGRRLGVTRRGVTVASGSPGMTAIGCAGTVLLPFPLSLLTMGSGEKVPPGGYRHFLVVSDPATGRADELALLESTAVATEFLRAVREILPDRVRPSD